MIKLLRSLSRQITIRECLLLKHLFSFVFIKSLKWEFPKRPTSTPSINQKVHLFWTPGRSQVQREIKSKEVRSVWWFGPSERAGIFRWEKFAPRRSDCVFFLEWERLDSNDFFSNWNKGFAVNQIIRKRWSEKCQKVETSWNIHCSIRNLSFYFKHCI